MFKWIVLVSCVFVMAVADGDREKRTIGVIFRGLVEAAMQQQARRTTSRPPSLKPEKLQKSPPAPMIYIIPINGPERYSPEKKTEIYIHPKVLGDNYKVLKNVSDPHVDRVQVLAGGNKSVDLDINQLIQVASRFNKKTDTKKLEKQLRQLIEMVNNRTLTNQLIKETQPSIKEFGEFGESTTQYMKREEKDRNTSVEQISPKEYLIRIQDPSHPSEGPRKFLIKISQPQGKSDGNSDISISFVPDSKPRKSSQKDKSAQTTQATTTTPTPRHPNPYDVEQLDGVRMYALGVALPQNKEEENPPREHDGVIPHPQGVPFRVDQLPPGQQPQQYYHPHAYAHQEQEYPPPPYAQPGPPFAQHYIPQSYQHYYPLPYHQGIGMSHSAQVLHPGHQYHEGGLPPQPLDQPVAKSDRVSCARHPNGTTICAH